MIAYRAMFDVPRETVLFTAGLLRDTAGQPDADLLLAGRAGLALVPGPHLRRCAGP